ncbi:MAG: tyrosine-type recombinase/integrase [Clostridia bacterium]|nr:tyrosine-type recombinase/integrase [Clostridia bacterium]
MRKLNKKLIDDFKRHLIEEERTQTTIEKYVRDISFFYKWCRNNEITKTIVLEYKQVLCQKYAPTSVNSIISSINSFFEFAGWHELKIKTLKIQKQIFLNKDKELTKQEYERLLNAARKKGNKRLMLIMQTICSSGIRVSELKFVTCEAVIREFAEIKSKGKIRRVFLPKSLCVILKRYIREQKLTGGSVFVSRTGKPIDRSNIWSDMKKLCDEAAVLREKVFPHNLRHLFARTFYTIEKDIVRLADILGHSSINTTRIYTMETGEIHQRKIQKLGLVHIKC